jgi:hypothetical protein
MRVIEWIVETVSAVARLKNRLRNPGRRPVRVAETAETHGNVYPLW